jgi:hypothetical protein
MGSPSSRGNRGEWPVADDGPLIELNLLRSEALSDSTWVRYRILADVQR